MFGHEFVVFFLVFIGSFLDFRRVIDCLIGILETSSQLRGKVIQLQNMLSSRQSNYSVMDA